MYCLGRFKIGQFDKTEECKEKSETGNVVSVFDGDVTTYVYEKPEYFKLDDLRNFIIDSYGEGYSSWIAKYREDEGDIFIDFDGYIKDVAEDLKSVCFKDDDGDEEYWEIFVGDKDELLCTNGFMSIEEVLEAYPYLHIEQKERELFEKSNINQEFDKKMANEGKKAVTIEQVEKKQSPVEKTTNNTQNEFDKMCEELEVKVKINMKDQTAIVDLTDFDKLVNAGKKQEMKVKS